MEADPVVVYTGATDALLVTLRLDPTEIDPDVLEKRARAIATPAVIHELQRFAGEFLADHEKRAEHLITHGEKMSREEYAIRHTQNEAIRAAATRLFERAHALLNDE